MEHEKTDDRVSLEGLDPKEALKALLAVDPDAPPVDATDEQQTDRLSPEHKTARPYEVVDPKG